MSFIVGQKYRRKGTEDVHLCVGRSSNNRPIFESSVGRILVAFDSENWVLDRPPLEFFVIDNTSREQEGFTFAYTERERAENLVRSWNLPLDQLQHIRFVRVREVAE